MSSEDKVIEVIDKLAAKLGVAADHLWGVLIAQARIDFISSVLQYALLLLVCYGMLRWARWCAKPGVDEMAWLGFAIPAVGVVVLLSIALFSIPLVLASLFNPEYWALHQILGMVKR